MEGYITIIWVVLIVILSILGLYPLIKDFLLVYFRTYKANIPFLYEKQKGTGKYKRRIKRG